MKWFPSDESEPRQRSVASSSQVPEPRKRRSFFGANRNSVASTISPSSDSHTSNRSGSVVCGPRPETALSQHSKITTAAGIENWRSSLQVFSRRRPGKTSDSEDLVAHSIAQSIRFHGRPPSINSNHQPTDDCMYTPSSCNIKF